MQNMDITKEDDTFLRQRALVFKEDMVGPNYRSFGTLLFADWFKKHKKHEENTLGIAAKSNTLEEIAGTYYTTIEKRKE